MPAVTRAGRRAFALALGIIVSAAVHADGFAQDSNRSETAGRRRGDSSAAPLEESAAVPLAYRRLMVPEEHIREEIEGEYLSMSRERFEAIVQRLAQATVIREQVPAVITEAHYAARFESGQLVDGEATWRLYSAGSGQLDRLETINLAIQRPRWLDLVERPATLYRGVDGKCWMDVEGPRTLRFDWSRAAEEPSAARDTAKTTFALNLPVAVESTLWLEVPRPLEVSAAAAETIERVAYVPEAGESIGRTTQLLRIVLPRSGRCLLEVRTQPSDSRALARGAYQLEHQYAFRAGAVAGTTQLTLETTREWPRQLVLPLTSDVLVERVTLADQALPFQLVNLNTLEPSIGGRAAGGANEDDESARDDNRLLDATNESTVEPTRALVIPLAEAPRPTSLSITLQSILELPTGVSRSLPRWRPQGWEWSAETTRLREDGQREFELTDLRGAAVTETQLDQATDGLTQVIEHFTEAGQVSLTRVPLERALVVDQGTWLRVAAGTLSSTSHLRMQARRGSHYSCQLALPPNWTVEDVVAFPLGYSDEGEGEPASTAVTLPLNVVERWQVEGDVASGLKVRVRLNRPIARRAPLRLVVTATRVPFPEQFESLSRRELGQVEVLGAVQRRQVLALSGDAPYRYQLAGDARCRRLSQDELPGFLINLLPETPLDLLVELDQQAEGLSAQVQTQPIAIVDAKIDIDVLARPGRITELYRFDCDPRSAKIDHLEIRFQVPRQADLVWEFQGDSETKLRAQRIESPGGSVSEATGETWRIDLLTPLDSPFRLVAQRTSPWQDDVRVSLAAARRALPQIGRVTVRTEGMLPPRLLTAGLTRRPAPPDAAEGRVCATFGYEPGAAVPGRLRLLTTPKRSAAFDMNGADEPEDNARDAQAARVGYLIRHREIRTQLLQQSAVHRVRCEIESLGARRLGLQLPPHSRLGRVRIEPGNVTVTRDSQQVGRYELAVSRDTPARYELELVYTESLQLPRLQGDVALHDLAMDAPILQSSWSLLTRGAYGCQNRSTRRLNTSPLAEVMQRLFAPLQRDNLAPEPAECELAHTPAVWPVGLGASAGTENSGAQNARSVEPHTEQATGLEPARAKSSPGGADRITRAGGVQFARVEVPIYHRSMRQLLQLLLIGLAGLTLWEIAARRRVSVVIGLLLLAVLALLGPAAWVPWLAALLIGGWVAVLLQWAGSFLRPARSEPQVGHVESVGLAILLPLVIGWLGGADPVAALASGGRAVTFVQTEGQQENETAATPRRYAKVIFPVDEQQQPVGDLVYVPRDFYERLLQADRAERGGEPGGRLRSVEYVVQGDWSRAEADAQAIEVTARLEIRTTRRNAAYELPFDLGEIALIQDRLTLDGQEPVVSATNDNRLIVEIPQSGDHLLEFAFVPRSTRQRRINRVSFQVPPTPRARCRVRANNRNAGLQFPTSQGAVRYDAFRGTYEVQLGAASRCVIEWDAPREPTAATARVEVERLFWMTANQKSVVVDGCVRWSEPARSDDEALGNEPLTLTYAPVPGWRILFDERTATVLTPASSERAGLVEVSPESDSVYQLNFTLVLDRKSGLGRFRFPEVDFGLAATRRDRYAVTAGDGMVAQFADTRSTLPVRVTEFARRWEAIVGVSRPAPAQVRDAERLSSLPPVITRLQQPRVDVAERNSLIVGRESTEVRFRANIVISQASCIRWKLLAPSDFRIESLQLSNATEELECSWSLLEEGWLFVQALRPVEDDVQIEIRGSLPTEPSGPMPYLALAEVESRRLQIDVYRQEALRVEVEADVNPADDELAESWISGFGRQVATFSLENRLPEPWRLVVERRPFDESQAWNIETVIERRSAGWFGRVDVEVQLGDHPAAQLDSCRWRIADGWRGPFAFDLEGEVDYRPAPDGNSGVLVFHPRTPLRETVRFSFSAPLNTPIRVPNVEPLTSSTNVTRWVTLPQRLEAEALQWEVAGLVPVDPDTAEEDAERARYRVARVPFSAAIQSVDQVRQEASVGWVAQQWWLQPGDRYTCRTTFDVVPSGTAALLLQLPAESEPVEVRIDGLLGQLEPQENAQWRLLLPHNQLPTHVAITYRGEHAPESVDWPLQAVRFPGLEVAGYLWSAQLSIDAAADWAFPENERLSAFQEYLQRINSMHAVIERSLNQLLELNELDRRRWFADWDQRFARWERAARAELDRKVSNEENTAALDAARQRHLLLAQQLGLQPGARASSEPVGYDQYPESRADGRRGGRTWRSRTSDATLVLQPARPNRWQQISSLRYLLAVAFGAAALLLSWMPAVHWLRQHRRLACGSLLAALGLIWISWLNFPIVGWVLLAMAVAMGIGAWLPRRARPTAVAPASKSSVYVDSGS